MARKVRKKGDIALIPALAAGRSFADAARVAGVSERTAKRRMDEPEFRKLVVEARSDMLQRACGELAQAATEAVATLRSLLAEGPSQARLGAARAVLEYGTRLRENLELEQRIVALETSLLEQ